MPSREEAFASARIRRHITEMRDDPKLSVSEIEALKQIGGMLSRVPLAAVQDSLLAKGMIEQKLGGFARTAKGDLWLSKHGR